MLLKHPDQLSNEDLEAWIEGLVEGSEPEGFLLDYKQEIHLDSQSQRRELAKDIVSFANERGGTLIYGIPENRLDPKAAPIPGRPYGIDPVPGLPEDLENIYATTIAPTLPDYRIVPVHLSRYPGKVCYIVWIPESWTGPHMVHGYGDLRYYRRGQYRSIKMVERDVEERYRLRLQFQTASEEFLNSQDAQHLRGFYNRNWATTALMLVPQLLIPNRVSFTDERVRAWLVQNTLWRQWTPSMRGVRTYETSPEEKRVDVELQRSGAIVTWRYTHVKSKDPPVIAYVEELSELQEILSTAARFYSLTGYFGPLTLKLEILCPESYALFLPRRSNRNVPLSPSGTNLQIRIEPSAATLIDSPYAVLRE